MLEGLRGYNIIHGAWRTERRVRGLAGPPNDFYEVRGDSSTELTYEQFCTRLEAAGVNWLRVKLIGWQNPIGSRAASFEPPPYGTFNIWQSALNPADLGAYRAQQVTDPVPPDVWAKSNLGQLITAAERHGVKLNLILFDNREFDPYKAPAWAQHAWNASNQYLNGARCEPQDRGFMSDYRRVFTHSEARAAAKARIDFALAFFSGHESVIGSWEIMAEQTWLARPVWMRTDGWDAAFKAGVQELHDWNEEIASYLKARTSAPVGISAAYENAVRTNSIRATMYDAPALDWVGINMYEHDAAQAHDWLRVAQSRYQGKQIVVQQYHPGGTRAPNETAPYKESKELEWVVACGSPGFIGPLRWPETQSGTYATPKMAEISGVTSALAKTIDHSAWSDGTSWDERTTSPLSWVSSWGDGEHVTALLTWREAGSHAVEIGGLVNQQYRVRFFDWLAGGEVDARTLSASNGILTLENVPHRENRAALYLAPTTVSPPDPPDPPDPPGPDPKRRMYVTLQEMADDKVVSTWAGDLELVG